MLRREVINLELSKIKPYVNNPRFNNKAVEKVRDSINRFGFNSVLVVDENFVIIAGHTRFMALKELGYKTAPCIIVDDLPDEKLRAFRLIDNKSGELAGWDNEKLELELRDIFDKLDFSLSDFDFEFDFDNIIDRIDTDSNLASNEKIYDKVKSLGSGDEDEAFAYIKQRNEDLGERDSIVNGEKTKQIIFSYYEKDEADALKVLGISSYRPFVRFKEK